jgi:hypothetical protein
MAESAEYLRSSGGKLRGWSFGSNWGCRDELEPVFGKLRLLLEDDDPCCAAGLEFSSLDLLLDLEEVDFFSGDRDRGELGSSSLAVVFLEGDFLGDLEKKFI